MDAFRDKMMYHMYGAIASIVHRVLQKAKVGVLDIVRDNSTGEGEKEEQISNLFATISAEMAHERLCDADAETTHVPHRKRQMKAEEKKEYEPPHKKRRTGAAADSETDSHDDNSDEAHCRRKVLGHVAVVVYSSSGANSGTNSLDESTG